MFLQRLPYEVVTPPGPGDQPQTLVSEEYESDFYIPPLEGGGAVPLSLGPLHLTDSTTQQAYSLLCGSVILVYDSVNDCDYWVEDQDILLAAGCMTELDAPGSEARVCGTSAVFGLAADGRVGLFVACKACVRKLTIRGSCGQVQVTTCCQQPTGLLSVKERAVYRLTVAEDFSAQVDLVERTCAGADGVGSAAASNGNDGGMAVDKHGRVCLAGYKSLRKCGTVITLSSDLPRCCHRP